MSHSPTTIVLLPGLHGSVRLFEPFVRELRRLAPGLTPLPLPLPPTGPQDYRSLAAPLIERLAPLGPLTLLAESFSGPLALHLAASPFVRVDRLILAASFCGAPRSAVFSLLPLRPMFSVRAPAAVIRHFLTGRSASDALVAAVRTEVQAARGKTLANRVRVILELDPDRCPYPEECRTLLLQSQHDALLPWEAQSELERRLPEAKVEWLDGPHLLLQVRPEDCARRVAEFCLT
jgi:pimeloyl-ACP methyl ester carboxylesterase